MEFLLSTSSQILSLYTILFVMYSILEISGALPQEMRSAGITLPALFSGYYGHEDLDFVGYHIKRTSITVILHSFLPLIYCVGLQFILPDASILIPWRAPSFMLFLMLIAVSIALGALITVWYWSREHWQRHPLAKLLSVFGQDWRRTASLINNEYREIDNFTSAMGPTRLLVTSSWIIHCQVHRVVVLQQVDASLHVCASQHQINPDGQQSQILSIEVTSFNHRTLKFKIKLKASDYSHLQEKLSAPVQVARRVVIQQSLSDQFMVAFKEQVDKNGVYNLPSGGPALEACLGCGQVMPEVKLKKMCASPNEGECRDCGCRPMWCTRCMSRWFASRQDQHHPETWMSSSATCPMCRQRFCMLDILKLSNVTTDVV